MPLIRNPALGAVRELLVRFRTDEHPARRREALEARARVHRVAYQRACDVAGAADLAKDGLPRVDADPQPRPIGVPLPELRDFLLVRSVAVSVCAIRVSLPPAASGSERRSPMSLRSSGFDARDNRMIEASLSSGCSEAGTEGLFASVRSRRSSVPAVSERQAPGRYSGPRRGAQRRGIQFRMPDEQERASVGGEAPDERSIDEISPESL